jgi:hypothetical protein
MTPRLFLVAPEGGTQLAECLAAACEVGDVASLVVPAPVPAPAPAATITHICACSGDLPRRTGWLLTYM